MSREIRGENFSLLQQRTIVGLLVALGASAQGKNVRIGSLQLIVHSDSAVGLQAGIHRQLDVRPEAHCDHHKIRRHYFTVGESHGFDALIAEHGVYLAPKSASLRVDYRDVTSALFEAAPNFRSQPAANHDGTGAV
jgi:hypothetical protein